MITTTEFTDIQKLIIQDICTMQIIAIGDLKFGFKRDYPDYMETIESYGCDESDVFHTMQKIEDRLNEIIDKPETLFNTDIIGINTLLSILNKTEDKYKYKYPRAVSNLFRKFFLYQDLNNSNKQLNFS